jgi:dipeptidyl aminopeptidase/acylaminoacyl peptidase
MTPNAKRALRQFRAPDEGGAEQRTWNVVRDAHLAREPAAGAARKRARLALAPVLAVIAAGLVLSPAGATVGRLITTALGVRHAAPMLSSLPSAGRILLSGPGGTWTAAADGSVRHLGDWRQASWSPRGLYVAVASSDRLAAVDPRGNVRWAIARPDVSDPRWFSPSGYRVAYLSAGTLRVIAGDGTGDHLLATRVADLAPAWRPGYSFQLAYVSTDNRLVVRDGDTGQLIWTRALGAQPRELLWSGDGSRLVVVSAHSVRTYAGSGGRPTILHVPGAPAGGAALSPDGKQVALVLGGDRMVIVRSGSASSPARQLLAGAGLRDVSWSPNGKWVLVSWPAADQWVFVRAVGSPRVAAVARIAQQFSGNAAATSSAGSAAARFPQLEGWCCTVQGPAG